MLRSLWLFGIYFTFLGLGLTTPFILTLGYVWVDTFRPQEVAWIILNQFPVSAIMGGAAIISYFAMDRRSAPPLIMANLLTLAMAIWVSLSLLWAVAPEMAWSKWDWAFKTILFSAFMPLVIRSRIQIEAFIQVYVLSLAANFVTFGIKTAISGGGYGTNLGLQQGNSGLSEGGLLSTACLMVIPLAIYLSRHTLLAPSWKPVPLGYLGLATLAAITAIGTYQRSALIGLGVLGLFVFLKTRHKLWFGAAGLVGVLALIYLTSSTWNSRISTITNYQQESSAMTRILVWKWTLNFVSSNPLGGGFQSSVISHIEMPPTPDNPGGHIQFGRAYHSIYFEVLGEHGWPGLIMFLTIAISTLVSLWRLNKRTKSQPGMEWCGDLADALQVGLLVFLSSGAFVGIAFQPMFWYFIAMSVCLRAYVVRVEQLQIRPDTGWRRPGSTAVSTAARPPQPQEDSWRTRGGRSSTGAGRA